SGVIKNPVFPPSPSNSMCVGLSPFLVPLITRGSSVPSYVPGHLERDLLVGAGEQIGDRGAGRAPHRHMLARLGHGRTTDRQAEKLSSRRLAPALGARGRVPPTGDVCRLASEMGEYSPSSHWLVSRARGIRRACARFCRFVRSRVERNDGKLVIRAVCRLCVARSCHVDGRVLDG